MYLLLIPVYSQLNCLPYFCQHTGCLLGTGMNSVWLKTLHHLQQLSCFYFASFLFQEVLAASIYILCAIVYLAISIFTNNLYFLPDISEEFCAESPSNEEQLPRKDTIETPKKKKLRALLTRKN